MSLNNNTNKVDVPDILSRCSFPINLAQDLTNTSTFEDTSGSLAVIGLNLLKSTDTFTLNESDRNIPDAKSSQSSNERYTFDTSTRTFSGSVASELRYTGLYALNKEDKYFRMNEGDEERKVNFPNAVSSSNAVCSTYHSSGGNVLGNIYARYESNSDFLGSQFLGSDFLGSDFQGSGTTLKPKRSYKRKKAYNIPLGDGANVHRNMHIREKMNSSVQDGGAGEPGSLNRCDICGFMSFYLSSMNQHSCSEFHSNGSGTTSTSQCISNVTPLLDKSSSANSTAFNNTLAVYPSRLKNLYGCTMCEYASSHKNNVLRHMRLVHKMIVAISDLLHIATSSDFSSETFTSLPNVDDEILPDDVNTNPKDRPMSSSVDEIVGDNPIDSLNSIMADNIADLNMPLDVVALQSDVISKDRGFTRKDQCHDVFNYSGDYTSSFSDRVSDNKPFCTSLRSSSVKPSKPLNSDIISKDQGSIAKDQSQGVFKYRGDSFSCFSDIVSDHKPFSISLESSNVKPSKPSKSAHSCKLCAYTSPLKWNLARHMRSHRAEEATSFSVIDDTGEDIPKYSKGLTDHQSKSAKPLKHYRIPYSPYSQSFTDYYKPNSTTALPLKSLESQLSSNQYISADLEKQLIPISVLSQSLSSNNLPAHSPHAQAISATNIIADIQLPSRSSAHCISSASLFGYESMNNRSSLASLHAQPERDFIPPMHPPTTINNPSFFKSQYNEFDFKSDYDNKSQSSDLTATTGESEIPSHVILSCYICGEKIQSVSEMKDHLLSCHSEKSSNSCSMCTRTYKRQADLNRHMRLKHSAASFNIQTWERCTSHSTTYVSNASVESSQLCINVANSDEQLPLNLTTRRIVDTIVTREQDEPLDLSVNTKRYAGFDDCDNVIPSSDPALNQNLESVNNNNNDEMSYFDAAHYKDFGRQSEFYKQQEQAKHLVALSQQSLDSVNEESEISKQLTEISENYNHLTKSSKNYNHLTKSTGSENYDHLIEDRKRSINQPVDIVEHATNQSPRRSHSIHRIREQEDNHNKSLQSESDVCKLWEKEYVVGQSIELGCCNVSKTLEAHLNPYKLLEMDFNRVSNSDFEFDPDGSTMFDCDSTKSSAGIRIRESQSTIPSQNSYDFTRADKTKYSFTDQNIICHSSEDYRCISNPNVYETQYQIKINTKCDTKFHCCQFCDYSTSSVIDLESHQTKHRLNADDSSLRDKLESSDNICDMSLHVSSIPNDRVKRKVKRHCKKLNESNSQGDMSDLVVRRGYSEGVSDAMSVTNLIQDTSTAVMRANIGEPIAGLKDQMIPFAIVGSDVHRLKASMNIVESITDFNPEVLCDIQLKEQNEEDTADRLILCTSTSMFENEMKSVVSEYKNMRDKAIEDGQKKSIEDERNKSAKDSTKIQIQDMRIKAIVDMRNSSIFADRRNKSMEDWREMSMQDLKNKSLEDARNKLKDDVRNKSIENIQNRSIEDIGSKLIEDSHGNSIEDSVVKSNNCVVLVDNFVVQSNNEEKSLREEVDTLAQQCAVKAVVLNTRQRVCRESNISIEHSSVKSTDCDVLIKNNFIVHSNNDEEKKLHDEVGNLAQQWAVKKVLINTGQTTGSHREFDCVYASHPILKSEKQEVRGDSNERYTSRKVSSRRRQFNRSHQCNVCGEQLTFRWEKAKHVCRARRISGESMSLDSSQTKLSLEEHQALNTRIKSEKSLKQQSSGVGLEGWTTRNPGSKRWASRNPGSKEGAEENPGSKEWASRNPGFKEGAEENPGSKGWAAKHPAMVDLLRLKRFQCSGCYYRSNFRSDVARHIRFKHDRKMNRIIVLKQDEAASSLADYNVSKHRTYIRKRNADNPYVYSRSHDNDPHSESAGETDHYDPENYVEERKEETFLPFEVDKADQKDCDLHGVNKTRLENGFNECNAGDDDVTSVRTASTRSTHVYCNICPYATHKPGVLFIHQTRHVPQPGNMFKCKYCPYYVNARRLLGAHTRLHRKDLGIKGVMGRPANVDDTKQMSDLRAVIESQRKTGRTRYFCRVCPYISCNRKDYIYHRDFHQPCPAVTDELTGEVKPLFECHSCPYFVRRMRLLTQHVKVHTRAYIEKRAIYAKQRGVADFISPLLIEENKNKNGRNKRRRDFESESDTVSLSTVSSDVQSTTRDLLIAQEQPEEETERSINLTVSGNLSTRRKKNMKNCTTDNYHDVIREFQSRETGEIQPPYKGKLLHSHMEELQSNGMKSILTHDVNEKRSLSDLQFITNVDQIASKTNYQMTNLSKVSESGCVENLLNELSIAGDLSNQTNYNNQEPSGSSENLSDIQTVFLGTSHSINFASENIAKDNGGLKKVVSDFEPFYDDASKLFYCDRCPYANIRLELLIKHQRFHLTKSEFGCHLCTYSVSHLHLLIQHARMHSRGRVVVRGRNTAAVFGQADRAKLKSNRTRSQGLLPIAGKKRKWGSKKRGTGKIRILYPLSCGDSGECGASTHCDVIDVPVGKESEEPMEKLLKSVYMAALELKPRYEEIRSHAALEVKLRDEESRALEFQDFKPEGEQYGVDKLTEGLDQMNPGGPETGADIVFEWNSRDESMTNSAVELESTEEENEADSAQELKPTDEQRRMNNEALCVKIKGEQKRLYNEILNLNPRCEERRRHIEVMDLKPTRLEESIMDSVLSLRLSKEQSMDDEFKDIINEMKPREEQREACAPLELKSSDEYSGAFTALELRPTGELDRAYTALELNFGDGPRVANAAMEMKPRDEPRGAHAALDLKPRAGSVEAYFFHEVLDGMKSSYPENRADRAILMLQPRKEEKFSVVLDERKPKDENGRGDSILVFESREDKSRGDSVLELGPREGQSRRDSLLESRAIEKKSEAYAVLELKPSDEQRVEAKISEVLDEMFNKSETSPSSVRSICGDLVIDFNEPITTSSKSMESVRE